MSILSLFCISYKYRHQNIKMFIASQHSTCIKFIVLYLIVISDYVLKLY